MDRSRERDESIERLLRQSLRRPQQADATDACLDAEVLAAMMDGGLSDAALAAAQSHLADCARCQSLVGAMARVDSTAPVETKHRAFGWLTWAVPLTAAAVVAAVWVAVPHRSDVPLPRTMETQRQAAEQNAPATSADRRESSPAENSLEQPRRSVVPEAQAKKEQELASELRRDAGTSKADELQKRAADAVSAPAETLAARPSANALGSARSNTALAGTVGIEIVSPDPMIRWRIGGSIVERSSDGGARWEIQPTGIEAELTAGSAASPSVVWIVGQGGVVLLSVDGGTWRRVPFPEMTDLSAARARDARSVSVTTADGRTFSTTDAGVTWVPRPLQGF